MGSITDTQNALPDARLLCRRLGEDGVVYLGARDPQRGAAAVDMLHDEGLAPRLHVVDVRDTSAVQAFAAALRDEHGGVDIVLSNAAARRTPDRPESEQIGTFVDTNNHGARRMIDAFGPILNDGSTSSQRLSRPERTSRLVGRPTSTLSPRSDRSRA
jgi:NAD(P)-dependent dehydrogenase (short-subunit alcohol dehydrogenase family)